MKTQNGVATIRKDLQQQELGVPVGEKYLRGSDNYPYRWDFADTDGEQFQIHAWGSWHDAESIDWDFIF